jgi:hypothetical protein
MDVVSHFVEILMGVVATLSLAIASMYRERIKASERDTDRLTKRVAELETKLSDQAEHYETKNAELRDRYEARIAEGDRARREGAEKLAQTSVDIINKGAAIVDVLTRNRGGAR